MKLKKGIFSERNKIVNSFCMSLRAVTPLIPSDLADHKRQLEKVYKSMLIDVDVIDNCCERFRRIFERN